MKIKLETARLQLEMQRIADARIRAVRRAVRETAERMQPTISREVREDYNVSLKAVKGAQRVLPERSVGTNRASAVILIRGRRLNIADLPGFRAPRRKHISVEIRKGQRQTFQRAWVGRSERGEYAIGRLGRTRYPLAAVNTLAVPQMVEASKVRERLLKIKNTTLQRRIEHNFKFFLKQG